MTPGGFLVIHAANEKKNKLQEEEEMTNYSKEELQGDWEFKFVRSVSGAFKKPEELAFVVEEEALSGWKLIEKFDDNRIRFKRPASAKRNDATLPAYIEPYTAPNTVFPRLVWPGAFYLSSLAQSR
ncbi:MAG: hypothetical protein FVQ83_10630 [Chloroflexi bacterium]|nr:hypothetical protein [Chloroflexota bacterium]